MAKIEDGLGRAVDRADRLLSPLEDLLNFIAAMAVLFLMLLGVVQIVLRARWLFNAPIFGYIDMIELSMPILAILGISYCQRHGVHIRMDILLQYLKGRLLWAVEAFASLAGFAIVAIVGDEGQAGATVPRIGGDDAAFFSELILTFFLAFVVFAVATDARAQGAFAAVAIGGPVHGLKR